MAKQLWLTSFTAPIHLGHNNAKLTTAASWWTPQAISEVRGNGAVTQNATTVAGPTNGIEVVNATSTLPLEWISEPLSADFTISGTITLNLWARESANAVNASINAVIEKIDGATDALTQIVKTARTTELTTTAAAANFTATPTSTACKRGDRLRVRVFADDAAANQGVGTVTLTYNHDVAAAAGDTWIQFTENLTFEPTAVTGSRYYLNDAASPVAGGKAAATAGGGSPVNAITNTAAGPTAGIQVTDTAGGTALEWYTPPLEAVSFGGKARFDVRCLESNAAANASLRTEIAICNNDGSGAVVWGTSCVDPGVTGGELGTTAGIKIAYPPGDDTAITAGQRLRFRVYVEDLSTGPLVAGHTVTVVHNGTTNPSVTSNVNLPVTVTEQAAGTAHTQPIDDTLTLDDLVTTESGKTAVIPDTLALADGQLTEAAYQRTQPDTLALTDAVRFDRALTIEDTLAVADSTAAGLDRSQTIPDTLSLSDQATPAAGKAATVTDTLGLADQLSSQSVYERTVPDTLALADGQAFAAGWALSVPDTLSLSDALAQAEEIHLSDTLSLSDLADPVLGVGGVARTQPVDDTLALADQIASQAVYERTVTDTLALADQLVSQATLLRTVADTLALADALSTAGAGTQEIADALALADSLSSAAVYQRTVADTLSLADDLALQATLVRAIADTLALDDLIDPVKTIGGVNYAQPLADTLALADALTTQSAYLRALADTLALEDTAATQAVLVRLIADGLTLSDELVLEVETLVEGFAGMFDPAVTGGRVSTAERSDDFTPALNGRSGSRTTTRALTSVQNGNMDSQ